MNGYSSTPENLINADAESILIGNVLLDPTGDFARCAIPQCDVSYFTLEVCRKSFSIMKQMFEKGDIPTAENFFQRVAEDGYYAGMLESLSEVLRCIQVKNPDRMVSLLRRKHAERKAWGAAEQLRMGIESGYGAEEIQRLKETLRGVEAAFTAPVDGEKTFASGIESIDALLAAPRGVVEFPFYSLNEITNGGMRRGESWIIAARPGDGKSVFSMQTAIRAARQGIRTLFCSLEMSKEDLNKRVLAAEGDIPLSVLLQGDLPFQWRHEVAKTLARIGEYPIEITDKIRSIADLSREIAKSKGLQFVVIDYLGLLDAERRENRTQEVSYLSRSVKILASDFDIPILSAHQLNRLNQREDRTPQLSDLRDSGSIEQDADSVLMLDLPSSHKKSIEPKDRVNLYVAKQRRGAKAAVKLRAEWPFCRLIED